MALLRNLRNFVKSGSNLDTALEQLSNSDMERASRQIPFCFFSAYHTLTKGKIITPQIHATLDKAIMDQIPGRTLVTVDVSGSMMSRISRKSDVRCCILLHYLVQWLEDYVKMQQSAILMRDINGVPILRRNIE